MKSIIKTIVLFCGSGIAFYLLFLFVIHARPVIFLNIKTPLEKQSLENIKTLNNIAIKLTLEDTLYSLNSLNYSKNGQNHKHNRDSLYLFLFLSNEIQKNLPAPCSSSTITAQMHADRYNYTLTCENDKTMVYNLKLNINKNKNTIQDNLYTILLKEF